MRGPSLITRLVVLVLVVGILSALVAVFALGFVLHGPQATSSGLAPAPGAQGTVIHLETVGAVGTAIENPRPSDPHPTWVGVLPITTFTVRANSVVTMVIDQEDTPAGLYNPYWAKAQGVLGGTFHMKYLDAQGNPREGDFSKIDDASMAAHSFAIPDLGVFVPLLGLSANAPANSFNVITFSFRAGKAGVYHWQCFVPCGSGTTYGNGGPVQSGSGGIMHSGNGGPMQTLGYMDGFLIVQ